MTIDFKILVGGNFYTTANHPVHINVPQNSQVQYGVFATNVGDQKYEFVYVELDPDPINEPPPETVFPGWAFISTSHFGDVGYPGLNPGSSISGTGIYDVGIAGTIKRIRAIAKAYRIYANPDGTVPPDYTGFIDVYYHSVVEGGGDPPPPPPPGPEPVSAMSGLILPAFLGGLILLLALREKKKGK